MIRLKEYSNKDKFIDNYIDNEYKKLKSRLDKNDIKTQFNNLFPESKTEDGDLNKNFFVDLLSKNLFDVIDTYPSVKMYYKIAFLSSINIKDICIYHKDDQAKKCRKEYLDEFLENNGDNFQNIENIIKDYGKTLIFVIDTKTHIFESEENFVKFQKYIFNKVLSGNRIKRNRVRYGVLNKIFDYKSMVTSKDKANVIRNLDLLVCPYCNRSYISNFKDNWENKAERTTADLDHFFYKSYFVLFSLSLYNFIPSCKICNSLFKGEKNMDILYPYNDSYEDSATFSLINSNSVVEAKDINGWSKGKKIDVSFIRGLTQEKKDQIEREIRLFRIREIYQVHNEYAEKLLYSKNILGSSVKKDILDCINKDLKDDDQKLNEKEFENFFYGISSENMKEDIKKIPLAKLFRDIIDK